ncbi:MAG: response regulator transcription factor [Burkholderiales bacterium]
MKPARSTLFVTHDSGLLAHWQRALGKSKPVAIDKINEFFQHEPILPCVVWLDLSIPMRPKWDSDAWSSMLRSDHIRVVAASSNPNDDEAIQALDAGCVAYCHAFSDALTLKQVKEVVEAGQVWIGKSLMQRLLHGVNRLVPKSPTPDAAWRDGLTPREIEIAILAANGASNQAIAAQCAISERTVKAHLSAVFGKLIITDRLQLALRVHGIQ